MNRRMHARLARRLVEACGGLMEAAEVCRIGKSQLGECQNPYGEQFMPADVIVDLEAHCGQAIYSRALFEARPEAIEARDLLDEASEATEAVAVLQRHVRLATKSGVLTPAERDRLSKQHAQAETELRDVGLLINREAG